MTSSSLREGEQRANRRRPISNPFSQSLNHLALSFPFRLGHVQNEGPRKKGETPVYWANRKDEDEESRMDCLWLWLWLWRTLPNLSMSVCVYILYSSRKENTPGEHAGRQSDSRQSDLVRKGAPSHTRRIWPKQLTGTTCEQRVWS